MDLQDFPPSLIDMIPAEKRLSVDHVKRLIKNNSRIVTAMAASEPAVFFENLTIFASEASGLKVFCANPSKDFECFKQGSSLENRVAFQVMFLTSKVRNYQGNGRVHYVPQHLSQWAKHLLAPGDIDVFWGSCSLPDERGFVSLGLSSCYESEVFRRADIKILEINPQMPVTFGATNVPLSAVDGFVYATNPLPGVVPDLPDEVDFKIGEYISDLVQDESTIQLGIGGIPNAVGKLLQGKKDLGIHTEMINDAMMELCRSGVVTNNKKSTWPGKSVGSFVYGSEELYRYVDKNPSFELQPSSVINDPYRIGKNHRMVSINTAVEVDLTGQVCSESIGHKELSGVGGASETHIGAQRSKDGRGVVALRSTTRQGASKIVFELLPGAKVSISRNDVDTVVTEYGVAHLAGKSVSERVHSLCNIAHPEFRQELLSRARKHFYL